VFLGVVMTLVSSASKPWREVELPPQSRKPLEKAPSKTVARPSTELFFWLGFRLPLFKLAVLAETFLGFDGGLDVSRTEKWPVGAVFIDRHITNITNSSQLPAVQEY
jgi:hypothetical protein